MNPPNKDVWNGDYTCINIECDKNIPAHIVEKQFTHPSNRVCSSCKSSPMIRWRCIGCNDVMNNTVKRSGTFYCSVMCRMHSNHVRNYAKIIKPVIIKNIKGCQYCCKVLTHAYLLRYCNNKCRSEHRKLEKHKALYKADMIKRAGVRMLVKKPNYSKEKRAKHKKKQQLYQKRRYNIKKLVTKIQNKVTYK
tara:strand:+ start:50 stop:625 length:576 start_codon:yes stop_codon:yes gene_type:complete